ncbi:MAG: hypothetical protein RLZZ244_674 [Verrucomicrobiota bacterium]|jgi:hypothetical protein
MIYSLSLENALVLVGVLLVAGHVVAWSAEAWVKQNLKAFPRSGNAGNFLYTTAAAWFVWLVSNSDLGEFSSMRNNFLAMSAVGYVTGIVFMREFLAVRALGILALLAGEPLLEAAWMRPEGGKLFLVTLVYAWIVGGLFCVGMPYLLRDAMEWISGTAARWRAACVAGIVYGGVLLAVRATL